jgi:ABC-type antimicrobial peptide transport system permease subunit
MAVREEPRLQYFAPIDERRYASIPVLLVRTTGPPALLVGTIRRAMQEAGPNLPYANVSLLGAIIEPQLRPWRLGTMMFALFGALALALALCGVYGVFSYDVAQRTRELGVRLALGARPLDIGGLIASAALRASALGVTIGALCAVGVGRALTSLLVGISPFDPVVFAVTSGGILATTLVATYLPARYAARVDPTAALRAE